MLARLKIAARLIVSFGLLNIMITCLNAYTIYQGQGTQELVDATLRAANNENKINSVQTNLYQARMNAWARMATGDHERGKKAKDSIEETKKDLNNLISSTLDPERKGKLQVAADILSGYEKSFEKLDSLDGRNEKLDDPAAATLLKELGDMAAKIDVANRELGKAYGSVADARAQAAMARIKDLNDWSYIIGVISLIVGAGLWWLTSRSIVRPINAITGVMGRLASGDLTISVPGLDRKDETGDMARAVQVFKENAQQVEAMRSDQEKAAATSAQQRKVELHQMASAFESSVMGIVRVVLSSSTQMQATAESMSAAAQQSAGQAANVGHA
ncbi:MAG: HAMP domain-containing protein, partial [Patescibacteria group bacterium]